MIFVTVGQMMPFDRLIKAVDFWAKDRNRKDIFAQIGPTKVYPKHIKWVNFLENNDFEKNAKETQAIVSHAGTGTIITALRLNKPILVMPRRVELKETRNDHQYATAKKFFEFGYIEIAFDEQELFRKLDEIDSLRSKHYLGSCASSQLTKAIRSFTDESRF